MYWYEKAGAALLIWFALIGILTHFGFVLTYLGYIEQSERTTFEIDKEDELRLR